MQIITLYRYERENGGVTVSPNKPNVEYTEMYRLVADDGKLLTLDGENTTSCADVESIEGWYEIDAPITPTESGYINAGGIR
jgi:hypothetical protein